MACGLERKNFMCAASDYDIYDIILFNYTGLLIKFNFPSILICLVYIYNEYI